MNIGRICIEWPKCFWLLDCTQHTFSLLAVHWEALTVTCVADLSARCGYVMVWLMWPTASPCGSGMCRGSWRAIGRPWLKTPVSRAQLIYIDNWVGTLINNELPMHKCRFQVSASSSTSHFKWCRPRFGYRPPLQPTPAKRDENALKILQYMRECIVQFIAPKFDLLCTKCPLSSTAGLFIMQNHISLLLSVVR